MTGHMMSEIPRRRAKFQSLVRRMERSTHQGRRIQLCTQAALYAVNKPCGIFYSASLEAALQEAADQLPMPAARDVAPNRYLHVMTRAYPSGGHTRVCERWIKGSPAEQMHDVVLLGQYQHPIPPSLKAAVDSHQGQLTVLPVGGAEQRAVQLRTMAMGYQAIILHVHGFDVVPMLALGAQRFDRPIVFYNHADHLFWLGSSIADLVVNFRTATVGPDERFRRVIRHHILPFPLDDIAAETIPTAHTEEIKRDLGFAADAKVVVSIGAGYKFLPRGGLDYLDVAKDVIAQDPRAVFLLIGPDRSEPRWQEAWCQSNGRINAIGEVPIQQLDRYIRLADVALESFPIGSPVGLLEIARYGVPCVALRSSFNAMDIFEQAGILCDGKDDLVARIHHALAHPGDAKALFDLIEARCLPAGFAAHLAALYEAFPTTHQRRRPLEAEPCTDAYLRSFVVKGAMGTRREGKKAQVIEGIRKLLDLYAGVFYPLGMTPSLYAALNSRDLF